MQTLLPPLPNAPVKGTALREYIARHFMSQAKVARAAGYSHFHANKVLRGLLPWDETLFLEMAERAGVPSDLLAIWSDRGDTA